MMSEKRIKRFNLNEGKIWEAIEGLSPYKTTYSLDEVCEKLNELFEENDELKQQLKTKVIVNKQYEELQRLKKENEWLRQTMQEVCELLVETVDLFSDATYYMIPTTKKAIQTLKKVMNDE